MSQNSFAYNNQKFNSKALKIGKKKLLKKKIQLLGMSQKYISENYEICIRRVGDLFSTPTWWP